ncbi:nucleotidyltransferase family protein [Sulfurimonas sp.]|uniref:nucleotidyltransferase family protein n=1 Tax=Sulfurimonas sp. TaxID=2022749 RepID=UPI00261A9681|nr:nucleotidyltransferase family protein [Sulfurimonas sp.]
MTKEYILEFLRENKELLKENYNVTKIGLFGSYSRDEAQENSDIDLLVEMPSSFDTYYDFKEFLEEKFNKKIDLGYEKSLRPFIKKSIIEDIIYV